MQATVPAGLDRKETEAYLRLDPKWLPQHSAIIMDGNGRWARRRHLPRVAGHRAGVGSVRSTVETAARIGIPSLTLYAFSEENWKRRPRGEVDGLDGAEGTFALGAYCPSLTCAGIPDLACNTTVTGDTASAVNQSATQAVRHHRNRRVAGHVGRVLVVLRPARQVPLLLGIGEE